MEKVLNQLVEKLQKAHGDRLVSVVLYGSAAAGDHHAKFSDLNVLCVLSEITPRELGASQDIFRWWREKGNPSPLLLTEHELATSTDCFAIEFNDIKRHHRLLLGKDVITPLVVDQSFYRAQVEHDLRAKLLRLRQKASGVLSDSNLLRRLMLDSVSTFCVLFRHALVLHGVDAPIEEARDRRARAGTFRDRPRAVPEAARHSRGAPQAARGGTGRSAGCVYARDIGGHRRRGPAREIGDYT